MQASADVRFSDLAFDIEPSGREDVPHVALLRGATLRLGETALAKAVGAALRSLAAQGSSGSGRGLPVEVEFVAGTLSAAGALISLRVGKGRLLSTTISIEVHASGDAEGGIIVRIGEIRGMGMGMEGLLAPVIDSVLDAALRPGIRHDRMRGHALVIAPGELMAGSGVPLAFATGGRWDVTHHLGHVEATFAVPGEREGAGPAPGSAE